MGGPGVFLGHPCPYLRKTVPGCLGVGNYRHGHGDLFFLFFFSFFFEYWFIVP